MIARRIDGSGRGQQGRKLMGGNGRGSGNVGRNRDKRLRRMRSADDTALHGVRRKSKAIVRTAAVVRAGADGGEHGRGRHYQHSYNRERHHPKLEAKLHIFILPVLTAIAVT